MNITLNFTTPCITESLTLNPGTYRFEVWGAEGGNGGATGGKGGYASGFATLKTTTKVFVNVGGSGTNTVGGCNGGGASVSVTNSGGGGTDIRLNVNSLYSRIIVAGGGGGSGAHSGEYGGFGGGKIGGNGVYPTLSYPGSGGRDDSPGIRCADNVNTGCVPGSFGYGGNSSFSTAGAGGGGWFGGSASRHNDPGGGGSGFVFIKGVYIPEGFLLNSDQYLTLTNLIGGNESIPVFNNPIQTEVGRTGNGAARITVISNFIPTSTSKFYYSCKPKLILMPNIWHCIFMSSS
jgi:hypothetical protein